MEAFLNFLYQTLKTFFLGLYHALVNGFIGLFEMVNVKSYIEIFDAYSHEFNIFGWILSIITILTLLSFIVLLGFLGYLLIKKIIRIFKFGKNEEILLGEVGKLNQEVIKLSKEKDRILELQTGGMGYELREDSEIKEELSDNTFNTRFYKLSNIDIKYLDYEKENINFSNNISLSDLCDSFRGFASTHLNLYYDIKLIRLFISSLATSRFIILQGISGTGKTSLPYAFGKFINNPTLIAPVEPSWKDKSDLLGYFNEFTKKFNETEILRNLYEATYTDKIYLNVLDEMNISRVEYYFAEMLSILELPSINDWSIDVVSDYWDTDPVHLNNGKLSISNNIWFIGTANNDDSTFSISDKVYDRAVPITINSRGKKFECENVDEIDISNTYLLDLFNEALCNYQINEEYINKLNELNDYLNENFRFGFGNRIIKQIRDFVPIYVACGGREIEAIDYLICFKVFRKFDMQNINLIKDKIGDFIVYLNNLFGENELKECLNFLYKKL